MLNYLVAIERKYSRFPRQAVLYIGEAAMKMESRIVARGLSFEVRMVGMRSLDGEPPCWKAIAWIDNILSILARLPDVGRAVRKILAKIADSEAERRAEAFEELTLLAGLRKLGGLIKEESQDMPILTNIMDHAQFGPLIRKARAEGFAEGLAEEGRAYLQKLVARRFGAPPDWIS